MPEEFDVIEFGRQFKEFLAAMSRIAPRAEPSPLYRRLAEHLGRAPTGLPVVSVSFPAYEHANVQAGLDAYLAEPGRTGELVGVSGSGREHSGLTDIVAVSSEHQHYSLGAVDYTAVPVGVAAERTCVSFGVYLVSNGADRLTVLLRVGSWRTGDNRVLLEVLSPTADVAHRFLGELREQMSRHNVFRGQVLSFEPHEFGSGAGPLHFHERPRVDPDDVILRPGALDAIHRQVVGVGEHRERLLAAGHHLKRGILLFGPPGTGKTHTVRHLMGRLPDTTVVVLTGLGLSLVREACALARLVPPALVVLEDVDLIAEERPMHPGLPAPNPLLFQVLNEMDGVAGDADVTFVLTTNRADLIEPALAERPGRVDLAVPVPLPDEAGRRRLLGLYGRGLHLTADETEEIVTATAGAAGSFFSELARRAELLAATAGDDRAGIAHARAALDELNASRAALAGEVSRRDAMPGPIPSPMPAPVPGPSGGFQSRLRTAGGDWQASATATAEGHGDGS